MVEFYFMCIRNTEKSLQSFKQGSDIIWCMFHTTFWLLYGKYSKSRNVVPSLKERWLGLGMAIEYRKVGRFGIYFEGIADKLDVVFWREASRMTWRKGNTVY